MKKADEEVFVPKGAKEESLEDVAEESGTDSLLGNAFDAFQDGDRAGFVRTMKAVLASGE